MKTKLLLFAAASLAIAASAPTFAGTSSPFDAKSAGPLGATTYVDTNLYAEAVVKVEPKLVAIASTNYIVEGKADVKTITGAKVLGDPDWKTIAKTRGVLDDGVVRQQTALVNGSAQGGGSSVKTTLAAGSGSSTAAPAIGYTVTNLAKLTKPDGSVTRVTA